MPWAVAVVRQSHKKRLFEQIEETGAEIFAPRIRKVYRRHGRKVIRHYLLFPGYLFVRAKRWWDILNVDGVIGLLKTAEDKPAYVPKKVIDEVRSRCDDKSVLISPSQDRFKVGQTVRVQHGPLSGVIGKFLGMHGQREIALLKMLNQETKVEFKIGDLIAV